MSKVIKHTIEPEVNVQHPYLGLSSFHERHKAYFYGRNSEIESLKKTIGRSTLTVFFGKSGLGKSSLLRAGLFPVLRGNYQLPIYLRINFAQSGIKNPIDQIKTELSQAIQAIDQEAPAIGEMTLWEYFHRIKILNGLVQPVLVFDQFEEVFTLGNRNQVDTLFEELGDLIENRVPLSVQKQYGFESLPFAHQFQNFKIIFSLREDYLAQLENYSALIPSILQNRFRLHQLNLEHALEAVYEPAKEIIEKKEAQKIVDLLSVNLSESSEINTDGSQSKIEIEPFLLSLICDRINQLRFDSNGNMVSEKITSEILAKVNIKQIVAAFYKEVASTSSEELNTFVEKHLLTSDGYRRLQPMIDTQELFDVPEHEIQELIDKRILRKEIWNGREQVELIHDVLVPVVKERRNYRLKKERGLEVQKILEKQRAEQKAEFQLEKKKQRSNYMTFAAFLVLLTALLAYIVINKNNKEQNREKNQYLAIAQQLSTTSTNLTFWNSRLKGILARHAYEMTKENEGKIDERIYMSLFQALEYLKGPGFGDDYRLLSDGPLYHNNLRDFILAKDRLYSMTRPGIILDWNFQKETPDTIASINDKCYALGADLENGYLFVGGNSNNLWSIDLHGHNAKTAIPLNDKIRVIVNDEDGNMMYAAGRKGIIYSWNHAKSIGGMIESLDSILLPEGNGISSLASSASFLAAGTAEGEVFLIDKRNFNAIKISFKGIISDEEKSQINNMVFHNKGDVLVLGNSNGLLMFYGLDIKEFLSTQIHSADIKDIQYHPERPMLAASDGDGIVTLWNSNGLERILKIDQDSKCKQPATSMSFDSIGNNLLVGYEDGTIIRWPINFGKLSDDICTALNERKNDPENQRDTNYLPNLSNSEWNKYIGGIQFDTTYNCPLSKN